MQHPSQPTFSRNHLLSILGAEDFERLRPHLFRVDLDARLVLEDANVAVEHVYFPEPSVASVIAITKSGAKLEVGLFGPEGMSGIVLLNGADRSPLRTFMQVSGSGIRISADRFREALDGSQTLRAQLLLYAQAFSVQVAYTALAYGRYTIEARLARWLLMCHDRVDGDTIMLTHEFLALMLGVRRAGITTALHVLEGARTINSSRGRIEILDRDDLIDSAGECYGPPEAEYARLIARV